QSGQPAARAFEHRRRAIDTNQTHARPYERQKNPARSASKLEDRSVGLEGDAAPERHVATPKRPRVLPVVERRVVVPALPAFLNRGSAPIRHPSAAAALGARHPGSVARGGPYTPLRSLPRAPRGPVRHTVLI